MIGVGSAASLWPGDVVESRIGDLHDAPGAMGETSKDLGTLEVTQYPK